ncbi:efflux RND transporter periplasmic adaptor subunit [Verrucomicrobiales bacterium]|nr:efflux RND transporter periplasmic adaptor subunit [Verrucomicrobiales bacterium]
MSKTRKIVNLLVAPLTIALAIFLAGRMISSRKEPPKHPQKVAVARVEVEPVSPELVQPKIYTYGNTRSYLTTTLSSQVMGEILSVAPAFEVGKTVSKGEVLVEIDASDYEAILTERESDLAAAGQTLAEEETRSRLASEDWVASGRKLANASEYTLRKPQLAAAKSAVSAARAAVEKAQLDVKRAQIKAPFDAIVESRNASPGNVVTNGANLGTLLARARIEARLPLTPQQVARFGLDRIDSEPPIAKLSTTTLPGVSWDAKVTRVEPSVDVKNQTLWVIAEIEDPFAEPESFLPVGAFVNAVIDGLPLDKVVTFSEISVVEDSFVWVVSPDKTLAKQPVEIVYSHDGEILAQIAEPLYDFPLDVIARPLASFQPGQLVDPVTAEVTPPSAG